MGLSAIWGTGRTNLWPEARDQDFGLEGEDIHDWDSSMNRHQQTNRQFAPERVKTDESQDEESSLAQRIITSKKAAVIDVVFVVPTNAWGIHTLRISGKQ